MKARVLRLFVLLWLGWYLSGPIGETFDFWDTQQQEIGDIARSASGSKALVAVAACLVILLFKKLIDRFSFSARAFYARIVPELFGFQPIVQTALAGASFHSPPPSLRI